MKLLMPTFLGILLVFAGCTATQPPPENGAGCICTAIYKPVCGVDGKTYSNDCVARCANVEVAYAGECGAQKCTDSDGGKNIYQKGSAASGTASAADSCVSATDISEAFCDGAAPNSEVLGCPSTHECRNGECIEKAQPPPPGSLCQDSDSGQDFYVRGSTGKSNLLYNDECTGLQTVKEYYCMDNLIQNIIHQCDPGERCDLGRCAEAEKSCSDTDGGNDIYDKGTVTSGSIVSTVTRTDACTDENMIREYYCVGDDYKSELASCPSDHFCENGECREADCEDSDGGTNLTVKGTVTKGSNDYTDSCADSGTVKEYSCDGDDVESQTIDCSPGYYCDNGRCIAFPV